MTRTLLAIALVATMAAPAFAFNPQPDPPKTMAGDGSVKTNVGSIKMGDGSVRVGIQR